MIEPLRRTPLGVDLARNGGVITLLTADTGAAWALIFRASTCEIHILAAGEDGRRTSGRLEKRTIVRKQLRAVTSSPGYIEKDST